MDRDFQFTPPLPVKPKRNKEIETIEIYNLNKENTLALGEIDDTSCANDPKIQALWEKIESLATRTKINEEYQGLVKRTHVEYVYPKWSKEKLHRLTVQTGRELVRWGEKFLGHQRIPKRIKRPIHISYTIYLPKRSKTMDFDDVLEEIGEFGRFQITNYLLICLPVLFEGANSLSYVFTAGEPEYRCFVPGCDNTSALDYSASWVSEAIPVDSNNKYTQCTMFKPSANESSCPIGYFSTETIHCDSWVYKDDERTIVNEWTITCPENQWKLSLVGTVHFAGILTGSVVFGLLADRFGRKLMYVLGILIMSLSGIIQAVSPNYIMFQAFMFINAIGTAGVYPLAFILGVEMVGKQKREMSGIVLNYFYAIGEALVGLIAWLFKSWVITQLVVSAPAALFILYYWIIPESVRWLIAKKKHDKAQHIIERAARVNGVVLSDRLLSKVNEISVENNLKTSRKLGASQGTLYQVVKICTSKKLIIRSIILLYNWAACAFVYYGLSTNSTSLGGNKYLNYSLVCLIEIPGYTLAWVVTNRYGRRNSLCASLLLCSVTCVAAAFVSTSIVWAQVILFLIGKLGITSSFAIMYIYTAELYPTEIRSFAVGVNSMVSRAAAMLAPFAPLLAVYLTALPLLTFGSVALIACIISFFLPETLGLKLPETVEELEDL